MENDSKLAVVQTEGEQLTNFLLGMRTASKIGNYEAVTLYKKGTASIRAIFDAVPDKSSKLLQLPAPAASSNRYP